MIVWIYFKPHPPTITFTTQHPLLNFASSSIKVFVCYFFFFSPEQISSSSAVALPLCVKRSITLAQNCRHRGVNCAPDS